jgi:hypothetical protein
MTRAVTAMVRSSTTRGCRYVNPVTAVLGKMNWSPEWCRARDRIEAIARNFARIVVRP